MLFWKNASYLSDIPIAKVRLMYVNYGNCESLVQMKAVVTRRFSDTYLQPWFETKTLLPI